jgi:hypothetical protein
MSLLSEVDGAATERSAVQMSGLQNREHCISQHGKLG